jgi:geranylgeranyl transferase type-2 subunit beta
MLYLDLLDDAIAEGLRHLGPAFCRAQLDHVLACRRPDGGFPGRRGDSDLYYTEFALRTLVLLDAPTEALAAAVPFLAAHASPDELTDVFSLLNSRRLLAARGVRLSVAEGACRDEIISRRVRSGGYGRLTAGGATAYATFLVALSLELLGDKLPAPAPAVGAIAALQNPDGGFAQEADGASQTNSTAAAVAFLTLADALDPDVGARARDYLLAQQDSSGGFVSRPGAPADLLSTFTALTTLLFLEGAARVDLAGVARFTRACAGPAGGFGAHPGDAEIDVEYTYYGVATLALLAGLAT